MLAIRIVVLVLCCSARVCLSQDLALLQKKADSLYKAGNFEAAAASFSSLSKLTVNHSGTYFRVSLSAAKAWARANFKDSAFVALSNISELGFIQLTRLATESDFKTLRDDRRWEEITGKLFHAATRESFFPINDGYTQNELIYGRKDGMALTMLRLLPAKVKPNGKTIIQIRSWGWGSNFYMPSVAEALPFIEQGYNVFIVFHGSEPVYTVPDAIEDVQHAVRFIRYNAKGYGLNPEKIGIIGNSAGGHLALMCALSDSSATVYSTDPVDRMSSKVQAAVSYYPVSNFLEWDESRNTADSAYLFKEALTHVLQFREWDNQRRRFEYVTDNNKRKVLLKQISPLYHVSKNDGAVLLLHGDQDNLVPTLQSELLAKKLKNEQVRFAFHVKKGAGHGWPKSEEESALVLKWFDDNLK